MILQKPSIKLGIHKLADAVNDKKSPNELLDIYIQASIADLILNHAFQNKYKRKATTPKDVRLLSRDDVINDHTKLVQNFLELETFFITAWKKAISKITAYKDLSNTETRGYVSYLWDIKGLTKYTFFDIGTDIHLRKLEELEKLFSDAKKSLLNEWSTTFGPSKADSLNSTSYAKAYLLEPRDNESSNKMFSKDAKILINNIWDKLKSKGFAGYSPVAANEAFEYTNYLSYQIVQEKGRNPEYTDNAYPDFANTLLTNLISWSDYYLRSASEDVRVHTYQKYAQQWDNFIQLTNIFIRLGG